MSLTPATPTPDEPTSPDSGTAVGIGSSELVLPPLARETAANFDELLSIQINDRLGKGAWSPIDLRGRLTRVTDKDQTSETWCLDGKPIMQTWPLQVAQAMEGHAIKITVTQPYRLFPQNVANEPRR